jgi:acetyltransferase-like isoleucine patch superfamily enzyme
MRSILETPWKIINAIKAAFCYPIVWLNFVCNHISWEKGWKFYGLPLIQKHRKSVMRFGPGMGLRSSVRSNPLGPTHAVILCTWQAGAVLEIGNNFGMTGGSIVAAERISIGDNVNVGANTTILDTDFHPLNPTERQMHPQDAHTAPIVIEDHVFIGMNCMILKGVTIGQGSVIGAGSVVTKSIPPGVIAAGNPARVIRKLELG